MNVIATLMILATALHAEPAIKSAEQCLQDRAACKQVLMKQGVYNTRQMRIGAQKSAVEIWQLTETVQSLNAILKQWPKHEKCRILKGDYICMNRPAIGKFPDNDLSITKVLKKLNGHILATFPELGAVDGGMGEYLSRADEMGLAGYPPYEMSGFAYKRQKLARPYIAMKLPYPTDTTTVVPSYSYSQLSNVVDWVADYRDAVTDPINFMMKDDLAGRMAERVIEATAIRESLKDEDRYGKDFPY
ncbi:MAG: hypothetical protein AABZ44_10005 [Elusimicrobiota bacterium]